MVRSACFVVALAACSRELPPQSRSIQKSQSTAGGRVDMNLDADGPRPIGLTALKERFPAWNDMQEGPLKAAAAAVNLVPGPCAECDDLPLAHCATQQPLRCEVVEKIARRAQRLAEKGMPSEELKVAINYPDFWFAGMGEGTPVHIHLYRDENGAFSAETSEAQQLLSKRYGAGLTWTVHNADATSAENLGVRSRPTWFINGHRFRGAQTARTLGRFVNFEILDGSP